MIYIILITLATIWFIYSQFFKTYDSAEFASKMLVSIFVLMIVGGCTIGGISITKDFLDNSKYHEFSKQATLSETVPVDTYYLSNNIYFYTVYDEEKNQVVLKESKADKVVKIGKDEKPYTEEYVYKEIEDYDFFSQKTMFTFAFLLEDTEFTKPAHTVLYVPEGTTKYGIDNYL